VFQRRVNRLVLAIEPLLPNGARVLDVGCGDGLVALRLMEARPDITVHGVDVLLRERPLIDVQIFDGEKLPFEDDSFSCVLFVDVLHHTEDPALILAEAVRVASRSVVIKDHLLDPLLAYPTLAFMDWLGNVHQGVALPNNYWRHDSWQRAFEQLGLSVRTWSTALSLYPWPASWVFGRGLHFVVSLGFNLKHVNNRKTYCSETARDALRDIVREEVQSAVRRMAHLECFFEVCPDDWANFVFSSKDQAFLREVYRLLVPNDTKGLPLDDLSGEGSEFTRTTSDLARCMLSRKGRSELHCDECPHV